MLTLAQAKELSQDKLTNHIIDEFVESPLMNDMPFDNTVTSNNGKSLAYVYNRVTTQPTAGTRAINGEYTAQETVTTQKTVNLKVMGGAYKIDRVLAKNEKKVVEQVKFQSEQKAKATKAVFHDLVINGDSAVDAEQFDGIEKSVTGTVTEFVPTDVIDLSTSAAIDANYKTFLFYLRKMLGKMDGEATHIAINSDLYAIFQTIADRVPNIRYDKDTLGNEIIKYGTAKLIKMGDKPGTTDPIIPIAAATGLTSLYAIRMGMDGVHGVSPEGDTLIEIILPDFKTAGAVKEGEVEFVGAIAIESSRSAAILRKIKVAETV